MVAKVFAPVLVIIPYFGSWSQGFREMCSVIESFHDFVHEQDSTRTILDHALPLQVVPNFTFFWKAANNTQLTDPKHTTLISEAHVEDECFEVLRDLPFLVIEDDASFECWISSSIAHSGKATMEAQR